MSGTGQIVTKIPELKPYAVDIHEARRLLGNKGRTQIYEAIAAGELEAVKDGNKTLITIASIERRQAALPPAKMVEPPALRVALKRHSKRLKARP